MTETPSILVVDDDENDVLFLRLAMERAGWLNPLVVAHDGEEAINYLDAGASDADAAAHPLPGLVLLDLKMPGMDGFGVLAWRNERSKFKDVPVVVLTSSDFESDRKEVFQLGATDYCVKPGNFHEMVQMLEGLCGHWHFATG